jgi:hypothetical protein
VAGEASAVGVELTRESKGVMVLQVKEALAEKNFVVEPGNCSAMVMIWEVETVQGHVASMHLMQQTAAGAADIAAGAAIAFPLPAELHRLVAVN